MNKRKKKREKKLLLLDKSVLQSLNREQRKELDSKRTILYPPILFIENAQHGLDTPSPLFDFENTVGVLYWVQRAKLDLIKGAPSGRYRVGAKIPTLSIYEEPEADRKEMEKQATQIVTGMEAEEKQLKNHISLLRGTDPKLMQLIMNHRDIPDENILREFNRVINHADLNHPPSLFASLIGGGSGSISKVRNVLDNEQELYAKLVIVDTLEKAYKWVQHRFYSDTESIVHFLCKSSFIPFSIDEQTEVFSRFSSEGKPHIDKFAPYARVATQLYLTIFLYLIENKENSSPQGALRDCEYLYYAIDTNVIFISSDMWHKKCIDEIPTLEGVRERFTFLPPKNKDKKEYKKVLNAIGIKA